MRDDDIRRHLAHQERQAKRAADAQVEVAKAQAMAARKLADLADVHAEKLELENLAREHEEANARVLEDAEIHFRTAEALASEDPLGAYFNVGIAEACIGLLGGKPVPAEQRGQYATLVAQIPIIKARVARTLDPAVQSVAAEYVRDSREVCVRNAAIGRAHTMMASHRDAKLVFHTHEGRLPFDLAQSVAECLQAIDPVGEMPSTPNAWREHLHRVADAASRLPDVKPGWGQGYASPYSYVAAERDCLLAVRGVRGFPESSGLAIFVPGATAIAITLIAWGLADTLSGTTNGLLSLLLAATSTGFFALQATRALLGADWTRSSLCERLRSDLLAEREALVAAIAASEVQEAREADPAVSDKVERDETVLGAHAPKARELAIRLSETDPERAVAPDASTRILENAKALDVPLPTLSRTMESLLNEPVDPGFIGLQEPEGRVGAIGLAIMVVAAYAAEYFRLDLPNNGNLVVGMLGGAVSAFLLAHRQSIGLRLIWTMWGGILCVGVLGALARFTFEHAHVAASAGPTPLPVTLARSGAPGPRGAAEPAALASADPAQGAPGTPAPSRPPGLQRVFRCEATFTSLATLVLDAFVRSPGGVPSGLGVFRTPDGFCLGVSSHVHEHERRPLAAALGVLDRDPLPDAAYIGSFRLIAFNRSTVARRERAGSSEVVALFPTRSVGVAFFGTLFGQDSGTTSEAQYVVASPGVAGWISGRSTYYAPGGLCLPPPSELLRLTNWGDVGSSFVLGFGNVRDGGGSQRAAWIIVHDEAADAARLAAFPFGRDCSVGTVGAGWAIEVERWVGDLQFVDADYSSGPTLLVVAGHSGAIEPPDGTESWAVVEWRGRSAAWARNMTTGPAAARATRTIVETAVSGPYGYFPMRIRPPSGQDEYLSWANGSLTSTFVDRQ